ncbi:hypothetical protein F441_07349 [Phytophthora nicotianae CJ01A1]|uniref:Uncharacterized protein n=1 Tax=Phytophthora nicotianae CJ01A1 TaxID=1317063 RepID=W2X6N7_PHYNI|nr:hypothetical protein F441_07349 [Phytophthora nicotianae CJ01A1]
MRALDSMGRSSASSADENSTGSAINQLRRGLTRGGPPSAHRKPNFVMCPQRLICTWDQGQSSWKKAEPASDPKVSRGSLPPHTTVLKAIHSVELFNRAASTVVRSLKHLGKPREATRDETSIRPRESEGLQTVD